MQNFISIGRQEVSQRSGRLIFLWYSIIWLSFNIQNRYFGAPRPKFDFILMTGSSSKNGTTEFLTVFHYFVKFKNLGCLFWGFWAKFLKNKEKPIRAFIIQTYMPNFISIERREVCQKSGRLDFLWYSIIFLKFQNVKSIF